MWFIFSEDLAYFINRESILHKKIIFPIKYVPPNLLFEQVFTQLMACQGFTLFIGTKYSNFLHFKCQCGCSVIYDKDSIDSIYNYNDTHMDHTAPLNEKPSTNTLLTNIDLYDLPIL